MRRIVLLGVFVMAGAAVFWTNYGVTAEVAAAGSQPVVLRASLVLDGRGHILRDTSIVVENGKIARLDPKATGPTYDLRGPTALPGGSGAHVHIGSHFDAGGRRA